MGATICIGRMRGTRGMNVKEEAVPTQPIVVENVRSPSHIAYQVVAKCYSDSSRPLQGGLRHLQDFNHLWLALSWH